ncbi:NAD(P)H-dependent oxidoreductase [Spiroplasma culicicola]|uniref:NADPH dehydrogenase n=1 Tax=Spiroplasma culicicola AES-1 TaxID=1276246 RepID=W6A7X0_9MOLU|nr:NAD(P)H-dependent oxidoreductase [Spiroplasma culicicola]AHI52980.1 NADPH dehydrogenase [Spiroplasma culicicola AES-1]
MKTVIVIANPKDKSYNHAIVDSIVSGLESKNKEYVIWDLYKMNFNPVLEQEEFEQFGYGKITHPELVDMINTLSNEAEQIIFVYPLFYFDMPAILKGFFDRIFIGTLIKDGLSPIDWKPSIDIDKTFIIQTSLGDNWSLSKSIAKELYDKMSKSLLDKLGLFNTEVIHFKNILLTTQEQRVEFLDQMKEKFALD